MNGLIIPKIQTHDKVSFSDYHPFNFENLLRLTRLSVRVSLLRG